jgi:hypothetical protein
MQWCALRACVSAVANARMCDVSEGFVFAVRLGHSAAGVCSAAARALLTCSGLFLPSMRLGIGRRGGRRGVQVQED